MGYVFISSSSKDKDFVARLSTDLAQVGIDVWRDVEYIAPGMSWEEGIKKALAEADAVLFVVSIHSVASAWAIIELELALANESARVIPLVIDDAELPVPLLSIVYVDMRRDYKDALQQLITALPDSVRQTGPIAKGGPQTKGYVFISYAEEDSDIVAELRDFMKDRGYAYWDYQESDRDYHSQMFLELEGVIQDAAATLSLLSPDWKKSQWAVKEYLFSEDVGTPVFLLMVREMGPTLVTAGIPYIDFTRSHEEGFAKLDRELKRKGL